MNDAELKNMWKAYNQKMDEASILNLQAWVLNSKTFEYLQTHKAKSKLSSLSAIKKWAVAAGILWLLFLGMLAYGNHFQNVYFSISVLMLMLFSITAIAVYIKQIVLINRINYSESVVDVQKKITALQISTIHIVRILWLQIPFYTTFFWSAKWISSDNTFWLTSFPITIFFTFLAIWLYRNISLKNADKKWFKILLNTEWTSISKAKAYLDEIEEFKNDQ
jgi:hypothetical protein